MAEPETGAKADLWGGEFDVEYRESYPLALLKDQAEALTARTQGEVRGVVTKDIRKGTVWISLYANAPALDDYMQKILTIAYPVSDDPANPRNLTAYYLDDETSVDDFSGWLKEILSSDHVHNMIANLLRYSRDEARR